MNKSIKAILLAIGLSNSLTQTIDIRDINEIAKFTTFCSITSVLPIMIAIEFYTQPKARLAQQYKIILDDITTINNDKEIDYAYKICVNGLEESNVHIQNLKTAQKKISDFLIHIKNNFEWYIQTTKQYSYLSDFNQIKELEKTVTFHQEKLKNLHKKIESYIQDNEPIIFAKNYISNYKFLEQYTDQSNDEDFLLAVYNAIHTLAPHLLSQEHPYCTSQKLSCQYYKLAQENPLHQAYNLAMNDFIEISKILEILAQKPKSNDLYIQLAATKNHLYQGLKRLEQTKKYQEEQGLPIIH